VETPTKETTMKDDELPPGQHIEREARYSTTGLSPVERDELIRTLANKGWNQSRIARKLGMTQPGVKYAIQRLQGQARNRAKYRMCGGWCGENFAMDQLNSDGFCSECATDQ
jgi:transcriptional regulator with GAF, ATPase, and Fis domain